MERIVEFTIQATEDLHFFKSSGQSNILKRIRKLIESVKKDPFQGIGKPEPLKHNLKGAWSRRISKEHRLVYEEKIFILSLKDHY